MIPTIGLMIGSYIITRMVAILFGQEGFLATPTYLCAFVTGIIAVIGMINLLQTGMQDLDLLKSLP